MTIMSLAWKVETCKRYRLSITGWVGGGLKTNGQSMKESKSHIRHCFRFFLHYFIISLKNVCSYLQGVIGGFKAEGKLRKFNNRISRVHFLSLASQNVHGPLHSPEVNISSDFVYPFSMFIFQNFELPPPPKGVKGCKVWGRI